MKVICTSILEYCGSLQHVHVGHHIAYLNQENRFAKCNTCMDIKDAKERTTDVREKKELQDRLDSHLARQR